MKSLRSPPLPGPCCLQLSASKEVQSPSKHLPYFRGWNVPTRQFCLPVPIERNIEDNFAPFPKLYLLFACSKISLAMPVSLHPHLPKQQRKGQPRKAAPWAAEHTRSVLWGQTYLGASEGSGTEEQAEDGIRRVRCHLSVLGFRCSDGTVSMQ